MTAQQAEERPRHGSQNLSFNGAAGLHTTSGRLTATTYAEAEWISWFSKGGGGSLQKVKLLKVSEQGKSEEWLLFSSGKTWSTTSQSLTYLKEQGTR